jgi:hypothetical protein
MHVLGTELRTNAPRQVVELFGPTHRPMYHLRVIILMITTLG